MSNLTYSSYLFIFFHLHRRRRRIESSMMRSQVLLFSKSRQKSEAKKKIVDTPVNELVCER